MGRSAGSEVCGAASAIWRWTRTFREREPLSGAGRDPFCAPAWRRRGVATARVIVGTGSSRAVAEADAVVAPLGGVRMTEAPCPATTFREACRRGGGQFGEHWPEQMPRISWLNFLRQLCRAAWTSCRAECSASSRDGGAVGGDAITAVPGTRRGRNRSSVVWRTCSGVSSISGAGVGVHVFVDQKTYFQDFTALISNRLLPALLARQRAPPPLYNQQHAARAPAAQHRLVELLHEPERPPRCRPRERPTRGRAARRAAALYGRRPRRRSRRRRRTP